MQGKCLLPEVIEVQVLRQCVVRRRLSDEELIAIEPAEGQHVERGVRDGSRAHAD